MAGAITLGSLTRSPKFGNFIMDKDPVQVASLTDVFFNWVQTSPEQVIFVIATYILGYVLLKKDRIG